MSLGAATAAAMIPSGGSGQFLDCLNGSPPIKQWSCYLTQECAQECKIPDSRPKQTSTKTNSLEVVMVCEC